MCRICQKQKQVRDTAVETGQLWLRTHLRLMLGLGSELNEISVILGKRKRQPLTLQQWSHE